VTDPRFNEVQTLLNAARAVVGEITADPLTPVEESRLRHINEYIQNGLATLQWFTNRYPDEETA
jgi:hypothetical protein